MCNPPILYVEDDLISRLANCAVLRESGFMVIEAHSATEAAAVVERHRALAALVTDIDLGPGPDGFEVARWARRVNPAIPVIYISATDFQRFACEGVADARFIAKPFDSWRIVHALGATAPAGPAPIR